MSNTTNDPDTSAVPMFPTAIPALIARGERNTIPSITDTAERINRTWTAANMESAFFSARTQIEELTRHNGRAAETPTGIELRLKWCITAEVGTFNGMERWHSGLVMLVLFEILRDLLLLKYGSEGVNIGINTHPYSYTVPDLAEGSVESAGKA